MPLSRSKGRSSLRTSVRPCTISRRFCGSTKWAFSKLASAITMSFISPTMPGSIYRRPAAGSAAVVSIGIGIGVPIRILDEVVQLNAPLPQQGAQLVKNFGAALGVALGAPLHPPLGVAPRN